MNYNTTCPACGAVLSEDAVVCERCQLKDFGRYFLSSKGYRQWKEAVLIPHQKKCLPSVYAGVDYALILFSNGDLYGIGKNEEGMLVDHGESIYTFPVLIAQNVRSAAAGLNYVAYVLEESGRLILQGTESSGLSERFPEITRVRKVYAHPRANTFWIRTEENSLLAFGENNFSEIRLIQSFLLPGAIIQVNASGDIAFWDSYHTQHRVTQYSQVYTDTESENKVKNGEPYRMLCANFGEQNMSLIKVKKGETTYAERSRGNWLEDYTTAEKNKEERTEYQPVAERRNKVYFDPVPPEHDYYPAPKYMYGSGLLDVSLVPPDRIPASTDCSMKKVVYFHYSTLRYFDQRSCWGILQNDGELKIITESGDSLLTQEASGIYDMSFTGNTGILVSCDGIILYGRISELIKYLNGSQNEHVYRTDVYGLNKEK